MKTEREMRAYLTAKRLATQARVEIEREAEKAANLATFTAMLESNAVEYLYTSHRYGDYGGVTHIRYRVVKQSASRLYIDMAAPEELDYQDYTWKPASPGYDDKKAGVIYLQKKSFINDFWSCRSSRVEETFNLEDPIPRSISSRAHDDDFDARREKIFAHNPRLEHLEGVTFLYEHAMTVKELGLEDPRFGD